MASRGRPVNALRAAAKRAGERFYADHDPCMICGTNKRYVSNAGCVECAVSRGKARYAGLDETAKADLKRRDHDRHQSYKRQEFPDAT